MHTGYQEMTDTELITALRDGDTGVMDYLMEKYKNLVLSRANSMYILGGEKEDLIQEGMIGLFKAIRDYDPGRDASFSTFCHLVVTRQLYSAVRLSGRKKNAPLNEYISLYSEQGAENHELENAMSGEEQDPEAILISREEEDRTWKLIEDSLSPLEKQVLDLHITGMKNGEIAGVLGRDEKSTENALQRVRNKLKFLLTLKGDSDTITKRV